MCLRWPSNGSGIRHHRSSRRERRAYKLLLDPLSLGGPANAIDLVDRRRLDLAFLPTRLHCNLDPSERCSRASASITFHVGAISRSGGLTKRAANQECCASETSLGTASVNVPTTVRREYVGSSNTRCRGSHRVASHQTTCSLNQNGTSRRRSRRMRWRGKTPRLSSISIFASFAAAAEIVRGEQCHVSFVRPCVPLPLPSWLLSLTANR